MEIKTNGKRNIQLPYISDKQRVVLKDINGDIVSYIKTGKNSGRITGVVPDVVFAELEEVPLRPVNMGALNIAKTLDLTDEMNLVLEKQNAIRQAFSAVLDFKAEIEDKFIKNKEQTDIALSELAEVARNTGIINDERYEEIKAIDLSQSVDIEKIYGLCSDLTLRAGLVESEIDSITTILNSHEHEKQTKESLGLGKVDNTSDIDKPVSKAVQEALDEKVSKEELTEFAEYIESLKKRQSEIEDGIQSLGGICANPIPNGGREGQVLMKRTDLDGDYWWSNTSGTEPASEEEAGVAKIATLEDAKQGIDDTKIMTPFKVKTVLSDEVIKLNSEIDANADAILKTRNDLQAEIDNNAGDIAELQAETTTTKNDLNDLGDQVSGIEERIPDTASATNQLADKAFVDEKAKEIKDSLGNVYKFKGSVNTFNDLPTAGNEVGDVYNVIETDVNYAWDGEKWDALGGVVKELDVQIKGTSIVKDGIANIPSATTSVLGVVKTTPNQGISAFSQGDLYVISANTNEISAKTQTYKPIVPKTLDYAVKTSVTTNTIDLTDEEKQAAQDWLGIPAVPTKTSELENDSGFITADDIGGGGGASSLEDIAVAGEGITFTKPIVANHIASADIKGSPTISSEGLLSNVTGSNYLHLTNNSITNYDSGKFFRSRYNWAITCKFKTPATKTKSCLFRIEPSGTLVLWCAYNNDSVSGNVYVYLVTTSGSIDVNGATVLDLDTWYTMRLSRDTGAGQYKLELAKEGEPLRVDGTTSSTSDLSYQYEYPIDITYVGSGMVGVTYDMKEFSVVSNYGSGINWTAYEYDTDKTEIKANVDLTGYLKNTSSSGSGLQIKGNDSNAKITMDDYNIAIGGGSSVSANTSNTLSVAIGRKAKTTDTYSVAIGNEAQAKGGVAIGNGARTANVDSVAIEGVCDSWHSIALLGTAGSQAIALGSGANASGDKSIAIGSSWSEYSGQPYSKATAENSIQIGPGTNGTANTMSVGLSPSLNVQLLDANGKIPNERLNTLPIETDGITTKQNDSGKLEAIGLIEQNKQTAIKVWTGTKEEYEAISTKDNNTIYNVSDDVTKFKPVNIMPDYSTAMQISNGWVAPYDCIGYCESKQLDNNDVIIYVDDVLVYRQYGGAYPKRAGSQWLVPKGSTVTFSGTFDVSPTVYKLKGYVDVEREDRIEDDYIIEYKKPTPTDNTWYRIYRSGWIEQGGVTQGTIASGNAVFTIQFAKQFSILPVITAKYLATQGNGSEILSDARVDGFTFEARSASGNFQTNNKGLMWTACGFGG